MRHRLLAIAGTLLLVASCAEEMPEKITPTPGEDVSFSANLNGNKTRTLYGAEEGNSVKVNWVDGDLINVYGTTCSQGRQLAEYKVNTAGAKDQNYATSLDKTGDAGVQWGDAETSDFYAVYPSTATITPNGENGVKVNATIRKSQTNVFKKVKKDDNDVWVGEPYVSDWNNPTMPDAVMYACTTDVKNGSTVDLKFKPISTVLKFHLDGFDTDKGLTSPTLQIQSITLTAPEGVKIAGSFGLDINRDGTISSQAASDASNTITISTVLAGGSYVSVLKDQPMEFNVFVIPQTENEVSINGDWSITVQTQDQTFVVKRYKYNLVQKNADKKNVLAAGLIHKLSIPQATIKESETTFDPSKWIEQIPRNVYLSELSIPGSWYSTNASYQETTDLTKQYNAGIRAFNIDCRLNYEDYNHDNSLLKLDNYDHGEGALLLACSGSDNASGTYLNPNYNPGTLVIDEMTKLADLIKPTEYIVVVLTIAEKPLTRNAAFGGTKIYGNVNPSEVLEAINSMLSENATKLKLYDNEITPTTTVNEVLGHMIVKVNVNTKSSNFLSYSLPQNALISEASMASDSQFYDGNIIIPGVFNSMQQSAMYWGNIETGLTYYFHQAQKTATDSAPTYEERKAAIDNIVQESQAIYESEQTNGWYQIGIGGYINDGSNTSDRQAVAKELNPYLYNLIEKKLNSTDKFAPSPVGIVLMNYCTSTDDCKGKDLVDAIIKLNGKFRLNRDPNAPEWYDNDTPSTVQSAKEGYSSGFNVDTENWKAF